MLFVEQVTQSAMDVIGTSDVVKVDVGTLKLPSFLLTGIVAIERSRNQIQQRENVYSSLKPYEERSNQVFFHLNPVKNN